VVVRAALPGEKRRAELDRLVGRGDAVGELRAALQSIERAFRQRRMPAFPRSETTDRGGTRSGMRCRRYGQSSARHVAGSIVGQSSPARRQATCRLNFVASATAPVPRVRKRARGPAGTSDDGRPFSARWPRCLLTAAVAVCYGKSSLVRTLFRRHGAPTPDVFTPAPASADRAGDRDDRDSGRVDRGLGAVDRVRGAGQYPLCRFELDASLRGHGVHRAAAGGRGHVFGALDQDHQPQPPAVQLHPQRHPRAEIPDRLDEALPPNAEPSPGEFGGTSRLPSIYVGGSRPARPADQPRTRSRARGHGARGRRGGRGGHGKSARRMCQHGLPPIPRGFEHGPFGRSALQRTGAAPRFGDDLSESDRQRRQVRRRGASGRRSSATPSHRERRDASVRQRQGDSV